MSYEGDDSAITGELHRKYAKGLEWALSASLAQKRAVKTVDLLFQILKLACYKENPGRGMTHLSTRELHRGFPVFARAIGFSGPFYREKNGFCPAVTFSNRLGGSEDDEILGLFLSPIFDSSEVAQTEESICKEAKGLGVNRDLDQLLEAGKLFLLEIDKNTKK